MILILHSTLIETFAVICTLPYQHHRWWHWLQTPHRWSNPMPWPTHLLNVYVGLPIVRISKKVDRALLLE